ncbi:MAG: hypothetical protein ACP6IP_06360 [Candidatus Njordarchaeia archaeon]
MILNVLKELLEELISHRSYKRDIEQIEELRFKAIRAAHKYHFENNKFYNKYVKSKGLSSEITKSDYPKILVPSETFKSYPSDFPEENVEEFSKWLRNVSSIPVPQLKGKRKSLEQMLMDFDKEGIFLGFSSGTSGKMTFLPRDEYTRKKLVDSYVTTVESHVELYKGKEIFILGIPKRSYLQIAWNGKNVANAISPGNVYFTFEDLSADIVRIRSGKTKGIKDKLLAKAMDLFLPRVERKAVEKTITILQEQNGKRVIFLAPPWFIAKVSSEILEKGIEIKLREDSIVSSTGGFKGREPIDRRKLNKLIEEALGVPSDRYTDLYGMTESNSIIMECLEGHVKHFPPWIEPILFDENLEPIEPNGKTTGRYGFLEPSIVSYPGFILTGDKITVDWDGCDQDDLNGPVILKIERISGVEERGCAGTLSRTFEG